MRRRIVASILICMFAVFGALVSGRAVERRAPSSGALMVTAASAATTAGSDAGACVVRGARTATDGREPPGLRRPIRVVATDWELLAPGVVANGGVAASPESAFAERGIAVSLRTVDDERDVREALALGGASEQGADVAVLSLPSFVASYDGVRALRPTIFWVVGWSRGHHVLLAAQRDAIRSPAPTEVSMRGARGDAATYFGLFVLRSSGFDGSAIRLTNEVSPDVAFATVGDTHRTSPPGYHRVVSTADASRVVMYVAVAPAGFLDAHATEVEALVRGWTAGQASLAEDVPAAARLISAADGSRPAHELVERLGTLEIASVHENARSVGLAGRPAATLDDHFGLAWQIWRDVGVIASPPPSTPVTNDLIVTLAREQQRGGATARAEERDWATRVPILVSPVERGESDEAIVERLGLLAGAFEGSAVQLSHRDPGHAATLADEAARRFDIVRARFTVVASKKRRDRPMVTIFAAQ